MGALKDWVKQDWVRIGTDGKIKGKCGTSKDKKNPDRCLPRSKANSLTQSQRALLQKRKSEKAQKVRLLYLILKQRRLQRWAQVERVPKTKAKRPYNGKTKPGTVVARGCGAVLANRRKVTKGSVSS